jgi:hypothetical protein
LGQNCPRLSQPSSLVLPETQKITCDLLCCILNKAIPPQSRSVAFVLEEDNSDGKSSGTPPAPKKKRSLRQYLWGRWLALFYFLFGSNVEAEWESVNRRRRFFSARYGQFFEDFRGRPSEVKKGGATHPSRTETPGSPTRGSPSVSESFSEHGGLQRSNSVVVEMEEKSGGVQTGGAAMVPDLLTGDAFETGVGEEGARPKPRVSEESEERSVPQLSQDIKMEYGFYIRPFYQVLLLADAVRSHFIYLIFSFFMFCLPFFFLFFFLSFLRGPRSSGGRSLEGMRRGAMLLTRLLASGFAR